nr:hypothetical protein [Aeropyrum camini]
MGCAPNDLVVVKFGGSILRGPSGYRAAGRLVQGLLESSLKPVVVVSAVKGVTDALLSSFERRDPSVGGAVGKIYLSIARELGLPAESSREVSLGAAELSKLLWAAEVLGQWTPRVRDLVVSYGERLSASLMAGLLRSLGVEARWLGGGEAGIVTDGEFGDATPLYGYTEGVIGERLEPLLDGGVVPVVAGFTGATRGVMPHCWVGVGATSQQPSSPQPWGQGGLSSTQTSPGYSAATPALWRGRGGWVI